MIYPWWIYLIVVYDDTYGYYDNAIDGVMTYAFLHMYGKSVVVAVMNPNDYGAPDLLNGYGSLFATDI